VSQPERIALGAVDGDGFLKVLLARFENRETRGTPASPTSLQVASAQDVTERWFEMTGSGARTRIRIAHSRSSRDVPGPK
jgi:hypothetical protein